MIKPNTSGIPGMAAMTDTLDFVKNLWGGMSIPGMGIPGIVMPTLSVEEINKQISDLKAVESWLTLNMNMLRGTIQALEVQSATISTLQSMGESFSAAVQTGADAVKSPGKAQAAPFVAPKPVADKAAVPEPVPKSEPKIEVKPTIVTSDQSPGFNAPQANPAVWWNILQDQFKQAVNSAMVSEQAKPAAKSAPAAAQAKIAAKSKTATPRKQKPAAKKAPKRARKA